MLPKFPRTRQEWLKLLRICAILTATAITCILIMYFSIPMSDTPQAQFDVILVLGNPAADNGTIAPLAKSRGSRAAHHDDRRRSPEPVCRVAGDDAVCAISGCTGLRALYGRGLAQH